MYKRYLLLLHKSCIYSSIKTLNIKIDKIVDIHSLEIVLSHVFLACKQAPSDFGKEIRRASRSVPCALPPHQTALGSSRSP